ncbi:hypothetical protein Amet_4347 [Alkaliphilus metalliredigens QYMF]|uniref:Phage protein Gp138 N-terminal domain-containing protein n=1 Tax=Alkaliphilus metalliredigens (strain QYMF) TaxID=293826 RepID=A6TKE4_ALKMQ|nr:hypothetical protein [Alkaliphilus metalliredigens]ABR46662.1 hypothetical protein Amet_0434 [Alkaliphilus metalliredigens QYMF]ABR48134.1 hypothetical protein Amet_1971 [Alkaliphilus metalliredigens QYMF]ABR50421.1 hypothetical protein Amet_4347 [Alkaliphilus metalliredigens QYMF]
MIDKVIQDILEERLADLHTFMLCRVVSITPQLTIRPIPKRKYKNGRTEAYPIIINPLKLKNIPLEKDDVVAVAFSERALDGVGSRKHDLTDAVILGVI